jgi:hypothetical protein
MINGWTEIIHRDYSHPCIVGWCPLNEHYGLYIDDEITSQDDCMQALFRTTKNADPTRPVIDSSGYLHRLKETDIYDTNLYQQDPAKFKEVMDGIKVGKPPGTLLWTNPPEINGVGYRGQPFFCSEFGGTRWEVEAIKEEANPNKAYGHGDVRSEEEFLDRFKGTLINWRISARQEFGRRARRSGRRAYREVCPGPDNAAPRSKPCRPSGYAEIPRPRRWSDRG